MTTAINLFLRTVIQEHGILFELNLDVPQETTAKAACEGKKMLPDLSGCKSSNEETIIRINLKTKLSDGEMHALQRRYLHQYLPHISTK